MTTALDSGMLVHGLPWSPLDFIPGIAADGDRHVHVEPLVRDITDGNDLRFVSRLPSGHQIAVCAERLPWDSAFFGYGVARLHGVIPLAPNPFRASEDYTPAIRALVDLARSKDVKYLYAAIDSRDLPSCRALGAAGFALVETRVYYHREVGSYQPEDRFACRAATVADLDLLTTVAEQAENPYDRFHADPFIPPADGRRLMGAWVRASVLDGFADATLVLEEPGRGAAGFCTAKTLRRHWPGWGMAIAQMVFGAAYPPGANLLEKLFSEMLIWMQDQGVEWCFFKTQINNRPVVKAAERLGYHLGRGEQVFRLVLQA